MRTKSTRHGQSVIMIRDDGKLKNLRVAGCTIFRVYNRPHNALPVILRKIFMTSGAFFQVKIQPSKAFLVFIESLYYFALKDRR